MHKALCDERLNNYVKGIILNFIYIASLTWASDFPLGAITASRETNTNGAQTFYWIVLGNGIYQNTTGH